MFGVLFCASKGIGTWWSMFPFYFPFPVLFRVSKSIVVLFSSLKLALEILRHAIIHPRKWTFWTQNNEGLEDDFPAQTADFHVNHVNFLGCSSPLPVAFSSSSCCKRFRASSSRSKPGRGAFERPHPHMLYEMGPVTRAISRGHNSIYI